MIGFDSDSGAEAECFASDVSRNMESVGKTTYFGYLFSIETIFPDFTSYLMKLKKK